MFRVFLTLTILAVLSIGFLQVSADNENAPVLPGWKGIASYYHPKFNGRLTSTGEVFSNKLFTAANNFLPLNTIVRVTNPANGKSVVVRINDRMNKRNTRLIDLSEAAARQLGLIRQGIGQVLMEVMDCTANGKTHEQVLVARR
jgi:rare lipoprotein A